MNKIQQKRLLNAAKAVAEAEPENFAMACFGHACGTPACVLGHYAARRDLQKTFKFIPDPLCAQFAARRPRASDQGALRRNDERMISFGDPAVQRHFGLSQSQCAELFSDVGCGGAETGKQAAKYIRNFVRREARK